MRRKGVILALSLRDVSLLTVTPHKRKCEFDVVAVLLSGEVHDVAANVGSVFIHLRVQFVKVVVAVSENPTDKILFACQLAG